MLTSEHGLREFMSLEVALFIAMVMIMSLSRIR